MKRTDSAVTPSISAPPPVIKEAWFSETRLTKVRLVTGLIIYAYVSIHFLNHSLGLISRDAMTVGGNILHGFIDFLPVAIILYGAVIVHIAASLWRTIQRKTLKLTVKEWLQLSLGIILPFLILGHIIGTRYATQAFGLNSSYEYVLISTFYFSPSSGIRDAVALLVAWFHGCLGVHMWLSNKPSYREIRKIAFIVFSCLLPVFALTGFLSAGRGILPLAEDGEFMEGYYQRLNLVSDAVWVMIAEAKQRSEMIALGVVAFVFSLRLVRNSLQSKSKSITIDFVDGPKIVQPIGTTLLEISKASNVPHASVCGGKGRCSTCRVQILEGQEHLEPANEEEQKVLGRVRAASDVRLACQMKPTEDLKVVRLLPSDGSPAQTADLQPWSSGREKIVTVMFVDLRDFTKTSESRLPFDVVYLINQFSKSMGQSVEQHDGQVDKFLGDGFMALFGIDSSPEVGAASSIHAAHEMNIQLEALNDRLADDLDEPLRMGVGIHTGSVILGSMGYGNSRGLTAIGDTVNTASRLETATKEQSCIFCISADTASAAGMSGAKKYRKRIDIRGKQQKLDILVLNDISMLSGTNIPESA